MGTLSPLHKTPIVTKSTYVHNAMIMGIQILSFLSFEGARIYVAKINFFFNNRSFLASSEYIMDLINLFSVHEKINRVPHQIVPFYAQETQPQSRGFKPHNSVEKEFQLQLLIH